MKHEVIVPSPGESITEVYIGTWLKKSGDLVKKGEVLVDLETQKTTFELYAEHGGRIEILYPEPETVVKPGDVIAAIDDSALSETAKQPADSAPEKPAAGKEADSKPKAQLAKQQAEPILGPAARKIAAEKNLDLPSIQGSGKDGRILKEDVLEPAIKEKPEPTAPVITPTTPKPSEEPFLYKVDSARGEKLEPLTRIRRQIAQNLVAAQRTAAILTTFNEVDMTQVMAFRKKHKEDFGKKFGVKLGIISFFALASIRALKAFPMVNATFTGDGIIKRDFVDLSIAVSTESGLVVPVIRDADKMNVVELEKKMEELAEKAQNKKLSIPEMTGGTFTISNGGVFGSLLSTPILNMPQSGILGLHKILERPIVVAGQIVARPMMYLALSYDHRIIDGREAVSFLVNIKEGIENLSLIIREDL